MGMLFTRQLFSPWSMPGSAEERSMGHGSLAPKETRGHTDLSNAKQDMTGIAAKHGGQAGSGSLCLASRTAESSKCKVNEDSPAASHGSREFGGIGGAVKSADSIQFSLAVLLPLCSPNWALGGVQKAQPGPPQSDPKLLGTGSMKATENRLQGAPGDPPGSGHAVGPVEAQGRGPRQEEASSASLERPGPPAGQESLFKARGLAFACQLSPPRSGMRKGRAGGRG